MLEWLILITAGFFAGILNAIAGGGSFLTFPALVYAGIPPVCANATSAVAVFPGYLGATAGFKKELLAFDKQILRHYLTLAIIGGLMGSLLLLVTSNAVFSMVVPWLLLFATLVFAFGKRCTDWLATTHKPLHKAETPILLAVSVYGGYFNGGLGIILLAAFITFGMQDLHVMNGLKNGLSLVLSTVSVITFAIAGIVQWPQAVVMMVATTIGGYLGALIAKAMPARLLRFSIVSIGFIMTIIFFLRY